jgi:hypothetical protein
MPPLKKVNIRPVVHSSNSNQDLKAQLTHARTCTKETAELLSSLNSEGLRRVRIDDFEAVSLAELEAADRDIDRDCSSGSAAVADQC